MWTTANTKPSYVVSFPPEAGASGASIFSLPSKTYAVASTLSAGAVMVSKKKLNSASPTHRKGL